MPLHLLGKKSWNVYNPANIERVRADEAAASALEAASEQRIQEYEAKRRLALLRNQTPPPPPSPVLQLQELHSGKRSRDDNDEDSRAARWGADEKKKRRKLRGEDDTDRDIRLAQRENEHDSERRRARAEDKSWRRKESGTLEDGSGHIQLFDGDEDGEGKRKQDEGRGEGRSEVREGAVRAKDRDRDEGGMSLQSAFGVQKSSRYTNAFGREDPDRERRDAVRLVAADPMTAMQTAQKRIRAVEEEREKTRRAWIAQREEEVGMRPMRKDRRDRHERKERHRSHHKSRRKHSDHHREGRSRSRATDSSAARKIQT